MWDTARRLCGDGEVAPIKDVKTTLRAGTKADWISAIYPSQQYVVNSPGDEGYYERVVG
jgi:hypothetical protein